MHRPRRRKVKIPYAAGVALCSIGPSCVSVLSPPVVFTTSESGVSPLRTMLTS